MDLGDLRFLQSDGGRAWLARLAADPPEPANHLAWAERLRAAEGPARASALLETALLRRRAEAKFSRAGVMLFERVALEQATAEIVARYRASIFQAAGMTHVVELGCGIGGDSLALAGVAQVLAFDRNPVRLAMARHNVAAYDHGASFTGREADFMAGSPALLAGALVRPALFFDPSRRDAHGRRLAGLDSYLPPVAPTLAKWGGVCPHMAVKVSPAVDHGEVPGGMELEFISVGGDVREGVLWTGDLRRGASRRATILPGPAQLTSHDLPASIPCGPPAAFLYEPDGAVIRAGLVAALAARLEASLIDPTIAYLTAAEAHSGPFARVFAVEDVIPFQLKRLRRYLRERGVGQVEIKKRGSALDVDVLRKRLRLRGDERRTLFLTRVAGEPTVIVASPLAPGAVAPA